MSTDASDCEIAQCEGRSHHATLASAQDFARLLKLAEERDSGQIARIARFLAATYNGQVFQFDVYELRAVDVAISNDMLCCLDALRWGRADLQTLVPDGDARVRAVIDRWGLRWPMDALSNSHAANTGENARPAFAGLRSAQHRVRASRMRGLDLSLLDEAPASPRRLRQASPLPVSAAS